MKKILLLAFIVGCLGCSKKNDPAPAADTWITGKWKITAVYNATYADPQNIDMAFYPDILTFDNNGHAYSYGSKTTFSYSLADMSINESGVIFKINQTSATTLTLTKFSGTPTFEMLIKQ